MKESNVSAKCRPAVLRGSLVLATLLIVPHFATAVYEMPDGASVGVDNLVNNPTSLAVGSDHVINGGGGNLASGTAIRR